MVEVDEQSDGPNSKTCTNGILPYMSCIILGFAVNTTAYHSGLYIQPSSPSSKEIHA